jgi:hypothetical protein
MTETGRRHHLPAASNVFAPTIRIRTARHRPHTDEVNFEFKKENQPHREIGSQIFFSSF